MAHFETHNIACCCWRIAHTAIFHQFRNGASVDPAFSDCVGPKAFPVNCAHISELAFAHIVKEMHTHETCEVYVDCIQEYYEK